MVINISKTFGIHDLLKNYCYLKDMNTFNVLTFIQVSYVNKKFTQIKKY